MDKSQLKIIFLLIFVPIGILKINNFIQKLLLMTNNIKWLQRKKNYLERIYTDQEIKKVVTKK